ncbi:radical SAM protein [Candidatus Dependentiae bacterium]|nr:radical SAM protein [Candidatus Dependentiae bacterium]
MKTYLLTTTGYTYLKKQKKLNKQYKKILREIVIPESEFQLFEDDFLLLKKLVVAVDDKNLGNTKEYKKLIKKHNPTARIKEIKFELTHECNLGCCHCYLQYRKIDTPLDFEITRGVINDCIDIDIRDFLFTGGEPTLYSKFIPLLEFLSKKEDLNLSLFTNGWWGSEDPFQIGEKKFANYLEFIKLLAKSGFKKLVLSIDGIGPDHDEFRKSPDLYRKNINIIKTFTKDFGTVEVQSILTEKNIKYIPEFLRLLKEYGVSKINLGIPERVGDNQGFILKKSDVKLLFEKGISLKTQYDVKPKNVPKKCNFILKPLTLWIKTDYLVTPCCWIFNKTASFGSIIDSDIVEILNNIQNTSIYKLHKNNDFSKLKSYISKKFFKLNFRTQCGPCMIAVNFIDKPEEKTVEEINVQVATRLGFLPVD